MSIRVLELSSSTIGLCAQLELDCEGAIGLRFHPLDSQLLVLYARRHLSLYRLCVSRGAAPHLQQTIRLATATPTHSTSLVSALSSTSTLTIRWYSVRERPPRPPRAQEIGALWLHLRTGHLVTSDGAGRVCVWRYTDPQLRARALQQRCGSQPQPQAPDERESLPEGGSSAVAEPEAERELVVDRLTLTPHHSAELERVDAHTQQIATAHSVSSVSISSHHLDTSDN